MTSVNGASRNHEAVVSPHWQASDAGREVLSAGGGALDAALATNAMLWATYPHMCGVGGDVWILYFDAATSRLHCLNGTGGASLRATPEEFRRRGFERVPPKGPLAAAVPGVAAGWDDAWNRFGQVPVKELLAPAIEVAGSGAQVTAKMRGWMSKDVDLLLGDPTLASVFTAGGQLLDEGATFTQKALADSLQRIADVGFNDVYRGDIANAISQAVADADGLLSKEDLRAHGSLWVEPVSTRFDGVEVVTTPPNSQGVAALEMLNLLSLLDGGRSTPGTARQLTAFLEAKRLAYIDRDRYLGDPAHVDVPTATLSSLDHARDLAAQAGRLKAHGAEPMKGDTVYLAAVDQWGNACSVIQSVYHAFGSGFVAGDTGILLANRGSYFSLEAGHPNVIAPGKRPAHTLMASMALRDGKPWLVFGTMGGEGQPQTNVQVLLRVLAGESPATAVAAPRVVSGQIFPDDQDDQLHVEADLGDDVIAGLKSSGQSVKVVPQHDEMMGHAHAILIQDGAVSAGTDPRSDG